MYDRKIAYATLLTLMFAAAATAQSVPSLISYQGRLTDPGGTPITGMSTAMTFSLWDGDSGGAMLWSESKGVDVDLGLFNVRLGDSVALPASAFSGSTVFLEVSVMGETLSPRQRFVSVPFAFVADSLDGLDSADFSLAGHTHNFSEITGAINDGQVPDNITIDYASDAGQLNGLPADAYVLSAGDSITGDLQIGQDLIVQGDAAILGGNIGVGSLPNSNYGVSNDAPGPPLYGAHLHGQNAGIVGRWGTDPGNHFGVLGSSDSGVWGRAGTPSTVGEMYGGRFLGYSQDTAIGVYGSAYGYSVNQAIGAYAFGNNNASGMVEGVHGYGYKSAGTGDVRGVYGYANNSASDDAYGGYFVSSPSGAGTHYGVYATADDYPVYAAWLQDPTDHYTILSSPNRGIEAWSGAADETGTRMGGYFAAETQSSAYGSYSIAYGHGTSFTIGLYADAEGYGSGDSYAIYGTAYSNTTAESYGVYGYGNNGGSGNVYGGYFVSGTSGTGNHYGVFARADEYPVYAEYSPDPVDHYVTIGSLYYGIHARNGQSDETGSRYGAYLEAYSQNSAYGLYTYARGYGLNSDFGTNNYAYNSANGNAYGSSNYSYSNTGNAYGGYFYASASSGTGYGVYASGSTYGLYVSSGTKNWVNPDPEDPDKSIVYATLEGGENGTYWRGTAQLSDGYAEITLPDHFRKVTSPDYPVTVTSMPRDECNGLMLVEADNERIVVKELMGGKSNARFDFIIMGKRLGYEEYEPIIDNVDYVPFQGNREGLDTSEMTTQEWYDNQPPGLKRIFKKNGTLDANGKVNEAAFREKGWKMVKETTPKQSHAPAATPKPPTP